MASTVLNSREQSLTHYEVLGISPTSTAETIEARFQSLIASLGDDDWEEFQRIEAAHHALINSQRRRAYDRTIGKTGPNSPPVERGPSHDPTVGSGSSLNRPAAAPFLVNPDSTEEPSALVDEPPADDPKEEPQPEVGYGWSRLALPVVGLVAIIAAVLSVPLMYGGSPGGSDTELWRADPTAAGAKPTLPPPPMPPASGTRQSTDQGADQEVWPPMPPELEPGADQEIWPAMPSELAALQPPARAPDQAAQQGGAQPPVAAVAGGTPVQTDGSTQAGAASSTNHAPAVAAPAPPPVALPTAPAKPQEVASATLAEAKATPPRWISGGLLNSDNKGGRFQGVVGVRITVRPDGRAGGCRVTQSSGNPKLDDMTCNLVQQRLQFSSARDAAGRPIESEISTTYTWGRRIRK